MQNLFTAILIFLIAMQTTAHADIIYTCKNDKHNILIKLSESSRTNSFIYQNFIDNMSDFYLQNDEFSIENRPNTIVVKGKLPAHQYFSSFCATLIKNKIIKLYVEIYEGSILPAFAVLLDCEISSSVSD